eukprot:scaffold351661_cov26-Prasinocladus_malaysianus.AAC.2
MAADVSKLNVNAFNRSNQSCIICPQRNWSSNEISCAIVSTVSSFPLTDGNRRHCHDGARQPDSECRLSSAIQLRLGLATPA